MSYVRWTGRSELLKSAKRINPIAYVQNVMSGEGSHSSYSAQLVDVTQVTPTCSGLPLNLLARGYVVADFRSNMRADVQSILKNGRGEIAWKIHPSADINFEGSVTVDAVAVSCQYYIL